VGRFFAVEISRSLTGCLGVVKPVAAVWVGAGTFDRRAALRAWMWIGRAEVRRGVRAV